MTEKTSYLTQVKRMKLIAKEALEHYPFKVKKIELMRYAANATYKITDNRNKHYQLRIHPKEWHTKIAILEEIKWLNHISNTTDIIVPRPILANNDQFVIQCKHPLMSSKHFCELFEWVPGRKRWRSINKQYANDLGSLAAKLHNSGQSMVIKHRNFWDVNSLVGTSNAKYYNVEKLSSVTQNQQAIITSARKMVFNELNHYQKKYKNKSGLIHGDLQPNNILYHHKKIAIIDFDDCGIGLYVYELATALHAFAQVAEGNQRKSYQELKEALFDGYSKFMTLTEEDIQLIPYCMLGIKLVTIGWLERHKDNLGLRHYYEQAIAGVIHSFKKLVKK